MSSELSQMQEPVLVIEREDCGVSLKIGDSDGPLDEVNLLPITAMKVGLWMQHCASNDPSDDFRLQRVEVFDDLDRDGLVLRTTDLSGNTNEQFHPWAG